MRSSLFALAGLCLASLSLAPTASAATISGTYSVTGSNFLPPGPFSSITESFTITFDNTQTVSQQTTGISLNASTITPSSQLAFTYIPVTDTLIVGGTAATVASSDPTSTDFALVITNASSVSSFNPTTLSYSVGQNAVYTALTTTRTAPAAAVTPEPSSFALLGTGLLGGLASIRRRLTVAG